MIFQRKRIGYYGLLSLFMFITLLVIFIFYLNFPLDKIEIILLIITLISAGGWLGFLLALYDISKYMEENNNGRN